MDSVGFDQLMDIDLDDKKGSAQRTLLEVLNWCLEARARPQAPDKIILSSLPRHELHVRLDITGACRELHRGLWSSSLCSQAR